VVGEICANPTAFGVPSRVARQVQASRGKAKEAAAAEEADGPISRIRSLQGKIQEVEVQASIREVQVKILEIKIKQVELMAQVRQAQQVMELHGREQTLLMKKRLLESRIANLDSKIREMGAQVEIDPALAQSLLQELQALLGQTEQTLAGVDAAAAEEAAAEPDRKPSADSAPPSVRSNATHTGGNATQARSSATQSEASALESVVITAKCATTGAIKMIAGLNGSHSVAELRAKVVATGLVSRNCHLLHNGRVLLDHEKLGPAKILASPGIIALDKKPKPAPAASIATATLGGTPTSPPAAGTTLGAGLVQSEAQSQAQPTEADLKALIKAEYTKLLATGMEKSEAAKEAIKRIKDRNSGSK